ncbi:FliA/WhiG family RNA polymerase sigma factor [Mariprofundus sp. EBB-1]|uniref:FliA/WhiG family RNA polymerase sigma factor n=1 Tax=Mariprofundus sp. EBB-1 TaxID=2650971 RepID=UPI000EF1A114|nr:FliA/WhiG family RNA polymerase sigma factor [Mariprofundus sp. EBB-1]RLL52886.1 FliA/WhiG family RNA polymerase sigma factor [Mariprofundus sp. EBB-1]
MSALPQYNRPPTPDELLEEYLPLVRYHADQLMRRTPDSIELGDLINAGVLGLLDGAQRFDHSREVQFKTFVSYRVRGSMIDYLRAYDWMPRGLRDSAKEMQGAFMELEQLYGRPAEEQEIADHLGINLHDYRERLNQVRYMSVIHFDDIPMHNSDGDEFSILETLEADPLLTPESQNTMLEFVQQLADAIHQLPKRENVLITLYYYEELTMKEIALILGLTESRVSQLHSQMVLRLRSLMGLN